MGAIRRIRHNLAKTKLRLPLVWLRHRNLNPYDVFIASYPRSGSTWFRFMLSEALTGQPADFGPSKKIIPYIGKGDNPPPLLSGSGRLFKTHERYCKEYKKAIYLVRDPRDVALSEYHYQMRIGVYDKSLEDFLMQFAKGKVNQFGSWPSHVDSWLSAGDAKQVDLLVVKFEDLRQRTEQVIEVALNFLSVRVDQRVIQETVQNNVLKEMQRKEDRVRQTLFKNNRPDIRAVGQGSVGGWRHVLTDTQARLIQYSVEETLVRLEHTEMFGLR